jgi:hypothetical protein
MTGTCSISCHSRRVYPAWYIPCEEGETPSEGRSPFPNPFIIDVVCWTISKIL